MALACNKELESFDEHQYCWTSICIDIRLHIVYQYKFSIDHS